MASENETIEDIVADIRAQNQGLPEDSYALSPLVCDLLSLANRIEAAAKRKADSIHRAMVIIAGIEMENSDDPPRLWTALEDAYDALSDAMGTDGETTADVEEAKTTGRHFVVKPFGNTAAMREVSELRECLKEAIQEKCPFLRMSCKHGEPCDYECGTFKWRKALKGASND